MPEHAGTVPRRTIRIVASTAAATFLAMIVGLAAWWGVSHWRLGRVVLTNDGGPLTVQVLGESDDATIGEPVELVRRATLALPPGDYRLRVTGEGRISRTLRFAVNRGESFTQSLTLDDNRLLGESVPLSQPGTPPRRDPIPFVLGTVAIELTPGKADFIELATSSVRRRNAATGEIIWDALNPARGKPGTPPRPVHPWLRWFVSGHGARIRPVHPASDIDGDGTRDLVWATGSAFLAASGKDGSVLWTYLAELDGPGGAYPEGPDLPGPISQPVRSGYLIGAPAVADIDRDGLPDLIATIYFAEFPAEVLLRRPDLSNDRMTLGREQQYRRVVVAISGRSGRHLWSHPIDPAFTKPANPAWNRPAAVVPGGKSSMVAVLDGPRWTGLDTATGRQRLGPIDLGFQPARGLQYADLDGDGEPEMLAVGPGDGLNQSLTALSMATGRPLWTGTMNARLVVPFDAAEEADFPLLVDLDGDGRAELAVPDSGPLDPNNDYRGVQLLDGTTGRPRWTRPMRPRTIAADGLVQIIEAPDLDRDGVRDLVTTSMFLGRDPITGNRGGPGDSERVYVDALSGKDGHPFWWWHHDRPTDRSTFLRTPLWWSRGPDGWPLLAVTIEGQNSHMRWRAIPPSDTDPPTVHMLEASTGRVVQSMTAFENTQAADLDGDGLLDLWGSHPNEFRWDLRAFRGEAPETWRALGWFHSAQGWPNGSSQVFPSGVDLDGDGIGDALITHLTAPGELPSQATGTRTAVARSGRDGRLLWTADLNLRQGWLERDRAESYYLSAAPMPAGDLDGDGTPDIIAQEQTRIPPAQALRRPATLPLTLLSGRSGQPLWVAGPLPIPFESHGYSYMQWIYPRIVEPGAAPDLIVRHNSPFLKASPTPPAVNNATRPHLARLSGRTGRVLWDIELSDQATMGNTNIQVPPPQFEDLDGDGGLDALFFIPSSAGGPNVLGVELEAVSLRDGRPIWSQFLEIPFMWSPNAEIFDAGEPKRPWIAIAGGKAGDEKNVLPVRALDGRDGKPRWTWKGALDEGYPWQVTTRRAADAGRRVCATTVRAGKRRVVVLDADGRETLSREIPYDPNNNLLQPVDLDGDGRDEFLTYHNNRLHARDARLETLWSRTDPSPWISSILPATADRPAATLQLQSGLALDGRTGRPAWQAPQVQGWQVWGTALDPGDSRRRPLFLAHPPGLTICRTALPTTPAGTVAPATGDPVPPGLAVDDPRWIRALPWTGPILYTIGPKGVLSIIGLALINVPIPLAVLWLAARRRPWTLRLLMALPIAAAVPLWVFQTTEPLIPAQIGTTPVSPRIVFGLATLAGVPIVALAWLVVSCGFRRRWKALALTAALTLSASALTAAVWIRIDSRTMPAIERYGWSGWSLVLIPGATAAGAIVLIGWFLRGILRSLTRLTARQAPRAIEAVPGGLR